MNEETYSFREASADDLPLLRRWLATPEVVRWWGPPEREAALLAEDLGNAEMAQWIVSHRGRPFAYAQAYEVHVWPQPHLVHLPAGAKAIDAFVGEPEMIGRGHGAAFLRLLAERLMAEGAPAVAIDPAAGNLRARRAYARAGFAGDAVADTSEGPAVVMVFEGRGGGERRLRPVPGKLWVRRMGLGRPGLERLWLERPGLGTTAARRQSSHCRTSPHGPRPGATIIGSSR